MGISQRYVKPQTFLLKTVLYPDEFVQCASCDGCLMVFSTAGLNDLKGIFLPKRFYDSKTAEFEPDMK